VLVFPEGIRGTGKPWSERYRLRRFGRGGFVEVAMRAGVPIVPVSVIGSEETYPMLADLQPVARLLRMPYFPITPTWPLLGPLGLLPLPSKWRITFHPPVTVAPTEGGEREPSRVMELADSVRTTIQAGVVEDLMRRQRVFRG
jgi:1-acyl-sn-glycerol-3-phosphate acyltransferase